ncbi:Glucose-6-phosphate/phosphate and phosphoenolpyruvate/phosphate antiporter [Handroanthus impetiginosus]|uniref:Glucose-6-phosphate/phosphate and phosphoenolpyruvate/phosphate antiporter n=1 Tax=Handroanthus impetiginosus TaxID=429701 RepID=A0A2G9FZ37_9LAMI|nr:Glucose-6-phosphate/phosphate and phosphoenolpyruvate/phosphate antiporter [Handroanthus impetiginosus]
MLSFFIRKDVRKILKRKDSDAGEKGRALEELRASMFSKLQSISGAKRQQQSLWGPTIALTFNFLVSVSIILMNKLVLVNVGFNYPIFLTFIHYVCSWLIMALLKTLSILSLSSPPKATKYSSLLSLGIVMSLSTGLANVSLKYNSVGFYQMAKIAVTPAIVLAEFILFRKRISKRKVLALTVVSIGVAVATVTDLEFHFFGACIAVAWIIPSAVNNILWSNLQQQDNWSALALMWKTTPITLFFLVMLMPSLDPPGVLSFNWNFYNCATIGGSAVLGFLLQWSGALALGATSATTHVVLGQFKTCVILLGGFLLFGSNPGMTSILGAATALVGMSFYTYLNLQTRQQSAKTSPRQSTLPLSKSKLGKENGDMDGGGDEHV